MVYPKYVRVGSESFHSQSLSDWVLSGSCSTTLQTLSDWVLSGSCSTTLQTLSDWVLSGSCKTPNPNTFGLGSASLHSIFGFGCGVASVCTLDLEYLRSGFGIVWFYARKPKINHDPESDLLNFCSPQPENNSSRKLT